jgi:uncharacterized protein (TIGR02301 family)
LKRAGARVVGLAALLAMSIAVAAAQTHAPKPASQASPPSQAKSPPDSTPPAAEQPPPYEPQLLRLAEMMGALAYLRNLCGAGDADMFRARMAALLDAEGVTDSRRGLLAGAYNRGFRDYQTTYRVCTPAANAVVSRYLSEMARIAAEVAGRYGG